MTFNDRAERGSTTVGIEKAFGADRAVLVDDTHLLFQNLEQNAIRFFAERADREGLTYLGHKALLVIRRLGPEITLGQIAEAIHVPPSSMTGIADRLVRAGLIERGPSAVDRRSVVTSITPKGVEAINELNSCMKEDLIDVMSAFSAEEIATFNALLEQFLDGVNREYAKRSRTT